MGTRQERPALTPMQQQILDAYGLKPWHAGLAPAPRWVRYRAPFKRLWLRITGQL